MPTLTVKNIPDDLYALLKRQARSHRRSVNSEIIVCIEQAVQSRKLPPEVHLARARNLREKTAQYDVTDEAFNEAKKVGRP